MNKVPATLYVYFAHEDAYSIAPCLVDMDDMFVGDFSPATESAHNGHGVGDEAWVEFEDGTKITAYSDNDYSMACDWTATVAELNEMYPDPKVIYQDQYFQEAIQESFPADFPEGWLPSYKMDLSPRPQPFETPKYATELDVPMSAQSGAEMAGSSLRRGSYEDVVAAIDDMRAEDFAVTLNVIPFVDFNLDAGGFLSGVPELVQETFRHRAYCGIRISGFEEHLDEGYAIAFNMDEPYYGCDVMDFAVPVDAEFEYWYESIW